MLANLARRAAARRAPSLAPVVARGYTEDAFNKKEKAHEDQYSRAKEQAQLAKMKESIAAKRAELAKLEAEHAKHEAQSKK